MKKGADLAFAPLGVIWGSNFIFMKSAAKHISPSQIVLLRVVFGFVPIFALTLAKRALRWEHILDAFHFSSQEELNGPSPRTTRHRKRITDQCNTWLNKTLLNRSKGLMLCSTFDCRSAPCHEE